MVTLLSVTVFVGENLGRPGCFWLRVAPKAAVTWRLQLELQCNYTAGDREASLSLFVWARGYSIWSLSMGWLGFFTAWQPQ